MHLSTRNFRLLFATVLITGLVACDVLNELSNGMRPTASVVSSNIDGIDLEGVTLNFGVEVQNPLSSDIPLTQLRYSVATEGKSFASGQLDDNPGNIPALGSKVINVPVRVNYQSAMQLVNSIQPGKNIPYNADLNVVVDAMGMGNVDIPLSASGTIPIPTLPEIEVSSMDWEDLSLSKAKGKMTVKLRNTNDFNLQLKKLNYNFSLADKDLAKSGLQMTESVAAGGETEVVIPIEFNPMNLGMGFMNLLEGSGAKYEIKGNLKVGTDFGPLSFPVSKSGDVEF
jgi:LEA14-like dessication related protein